MKQYLRQRKPEAVLDPFAGTGTTPLLASGMGVEATGIEISPVGILAAQAIVLAANDLPAIRFRSAAAAMLDRIASQKEASDEFVYPHVQITESAFPCETEEEIAKAREFIGYIDDPDIQTMLNLACVSVLEDVSYTSKDGQYLRWDRRSGKNIRSKVQKSKILPFSDALKSRLDEIGEDLSFLKEHYAGKPPNLIEGSSLENLRELDDASFDMVITSPPYANRYDYTRTYALELAWLGHDQEAFKALRQNMLSATVENKSKKDRLQELYGESTLLKSALEVYECQSALREVITLLNARTKELSNPHIVRMLEGYFLEMALVIAELGRVVRPGGIVIMVNDNVQYDGEELPVDLILSDYAEQSGFQCNHIWQLPRGKGNSSQQMSRYGRRELRKGVYWWTRRDF